MPQNRWHGLVSFRSKFRLANGLGRTRPDRERVEIDEKFNEMIDKSFEETGYDDGDELTIIR